MLVFRRIRRALGVAVAVSVPFSVLLLVVLPIATALAGPTVTVRVEGESATLLPLTTVTLSAPEPVSGCPANSVAAALNLAVAGNWDHGEANHGGGDFTETILGETRTFTHESDTWAEWVNDKWGGGICSDLLSNGDEVLMVADREPEPFFSPTVLPLVVTGAPASVQTGMPFTVHVSAIHTPPAAFAEPGQGTPEPAEGVTVAGEGAAAATSSAGGVAAVTLTTAGPVTLRATKLGYAASAPFVVCAHNGNDGNCGTSGPSGTSQSSSSLSSTSVGGVLSQRSQAASSALAADLTGILEGHHYSSRDAPRVLSGRVVTPSPVTSISLRLRRTYHGRCWAYSGVRERLERVRCRAGGFFRIASGGEVFSYLLPSRLPPGRYVLDVEATDAAGNRTTLARDTSRFVFYVG